MSDLAIHRILASQASEITDYNLNLDFATTGIVPPEVTFTRASTATYFDVAGVLQTAAINTPRIDYDPVTHACLGLFIEESRTNSISNNTAVGAVAGTPGTLPTSWQKAEAASLTFNVVGSGIDSGVDYVDIRLSGTASSSSTNAIQFSQSSQISASNGQAWTNSAYLKIVAGSTSGVNSIKLAWEERSGVFLAAQVSPALTISTTGSFSTCRKSHSATNANASTTFVKPLIQFSPISGQVIDVTIRIGLPQMELGAFSTSAIKTSAAAATRSADVASMTGTNFSSWYNQTEGTFVGSCTSLGDALPSTRSPALLTVSDGALSNYMAIVAGNSGPTQRRFDVVTAGVSQAQCLRSGVSSSTKHTFAASYKVNDFSMYMDTLAASIDLIGTLPVVNQLIIGGLGTGGTNFLNGYISRITYYPTRLSDTTLQLLSKNL